MPAYLISAIIGFVAGVGIAACIAAVIGISSRRRTLAALAARVMPVLERKALAMGIATNSSPHVRLDAEGNVVVEGDDAVDRMLRLVDAIEAGETGQIAYSDTLRVSRDEVALIIEARKQRKTAGV